MTEPSATTEPEPNRPTDRPAEPEPRPGLSRRGLFGLGGGLGVAAGAIVGGFGGAALAPRASGSHLEHGFFGEHQAGIATPAQDRLHFAAFDLRDDAGRDDLIELLKDWTYAASRLTLGADVSARGAFDGGPYLPPDDTGEAAGLDASGLTITFGFGRTLFRAADGTDRFGLADQLPTDFEPLPKMANDFISPERSGGDLCVQACANDPQVAVHAIRNLTRIAFGRATLRWSQLGFGRTSSTSTAQSTPRNLFGQKDGTRNLKAEEPQRLAEHVWIADGPAWAHGGSYLVARRIAMTIEVWDGLQLSEQDRVLGRDKRHGAPLSGGTEFSDPDFAKTGPTGRPLIDPRSHVAPDRAGEQRRHRHAAPRLQLRRRQRRHRTPGRRPVLPIRLREVAGPLRRRAHQHGPRRHVRGVLEDHVVVGIPGAAGHPRGPVRRPGPLRSLSRQVDSGGSFEDRIP